MMVHQRRSLNLFQQRLYSGLLFGIDNIDSVKKLHFYSSYMDVQLTYKLLNEKRNVYLEAGQDIARTNHSTMGKYFEWLISNVSKWIDKNEFYDREVILKNVHQIIQSKGQFVCLLGGKSTGKTLLFDNLRQQPNKYNYKQSNILHLNTREFLEGDILDSSLLSTLLGTQVERTGSKEYDIGNKEVVKPMVQVVIGYLTTILIIPENSIPKVPEIMKKLEERNIKPSSAMMKEYYCGDRLGQFLR
jgi:hypothetical protein